jgi:hypothetical protein
MKVICNVRPQGRRLEASLSENLLVLFQVGLCHHVKGDLRSFCHSVLIFQAIEL